MLNLEDICECGECLGIDAQGLVAGAVQLAALRALRGAASAGRSDCPRCGGRVGPTEVVVDTVGHAHKVQSCTSCAALWVTP